MKFKRGVEFAKMHTAMWYARATAEWVSQRTIGRGAVITSTRDGVHSKNSLHYEGKAIDLRTRDLSTRDKLRYRDALSVALGPDYDVVAEKTHIHLEYDPD